jgi:methionyl-tRNA formyltransferase
MRIFIITMDDPVQTNDFIKSIIKSRQPDIAGLAVSKGDRMTIGKKRSKVVYLFSLLLIMGIRGFVRNSYTTLSFKARKMLAKYGIGKSPSISNFASTKGIPVFEIKTPNSKSFLEKLKELKPDVVINQSQNILKKDLLDIPSIGVINRHNALLPKNRGRLTPFWVLFNKEKETGVSIHFVTEDIDAGDIIVQDKYSVERKDTFNSLVRKNYKIAPGAMLKALEYLEKGSFDLIRNDASKATYNSVPTFRNALHYRLNIIKKSFGFYD